MRYAAYGSNLHPLRLSERISSASLIETRFVPDWSLRFHKRSIDDSGKCSIVSGGTGIYAAIFDISTADKIVLDNIEGLGCGYTEISLPVPEIGVCMSYAAADLYVDDSLVPYDWYKELVLVGARGHAFPASYIDEIIAVSTRQDPNRHRRAENLAIVKLARADTLRCATVMGQKAKK